MSPDDIQRFFGPTPCLIEPDWLESWIVHEDDDVIVFNKPGWLVCHPAKNGPWSSLASAVGNIRPLKRIHLVHRLDRETSGIVVFAKHRASASRLQTAFADQNVSKTYLAILRGSLTQPETVDSHIEDDRGAAVAVKQRVTFSKSGKHAITRFEPLHAWDKNHTLVRVYPTGGRKHQIRVHADWLGHPVAGDKIYGGDPDCYLQFIQSGWSDDLAKRLHGFHRQALHAESLHIFGDTFSVQFNAPCPFQQEFSL